MEFNFMNPPQGNSEPDRKDILISNLLCMICDHTEIRKEQYESWLCLEVGMTEEEIEYMKSIDCFPEPEE